MSMARLKSAELMSALGEIGLPKRAQAVSSFLDTFHQNWMENYETRS